MSQAEAQFKVPLLREWYWNGWWIGHEHPPKRPEPVDVHPSRNVAYPVSQIEGCFSWIQFPQAASLHATEADALQAAIEKETERIAQHQKVIDRFRERLSQLESK